jgi:hypothetical protein
MLAFRGAAGAVLLPHEEDPSGVAQQALLDPFATGAGLGAWLLFVPIIYLAYAKLPEQEEVI